MAPEATETTARGEPTPGKFKRSSKQRILELIKSLESDDDERTAISKKISWILRHGAQKVNVKMDSEGWVKVGDLLATEILEDVSKELLMAVIVDSNAQKLRYKLKDAPEGQFIKAYSKTERKATTNAISTPIETEKTPQGSLRQDAPAFVPSGVFNPTAALPHMGYPWMPGGFGFPPMMPQWPGAYPMPPYMIEGSTALPGGSARYQGRIKSFNPEKGFGFIACDETHAQFNRDVFLHKAQFGDMSVGTEVTFLVETNNKGMPQAKDLAVFGGPGTAPTSSGKAGGGKGKGGRGKGGRGQGKGGGKSERASKGNGKEPQAEPSTTAGRPTAEALVVEATLAEDPVAQGGSAGDSSSATALAAGTPVAETGLGALAA